MAYTKCWMEKKPAAKNTLSRKALIQKRRRGEVLPKITKLKDFMTTATTVSVILKCFLWMETKYHKREYEKQKKTQNSKMSFYVKISQGINKCKEVKYNIKYLKYGEQWKEEWV